MPINVFGEGAVQTAYVGFRAFSLGENTQLFWPNAFQDTPDVVAAYMQVVANVGPLELTLPNATQVSVGQNFIISNVGIPNFSLRDNEDGDLGAIESGKEYYYILEDNSTPAGEWRRVTFGAGTSEATAAELAGLGLTSRADRLDTNVTIVTTNGPAFGIDELNNAQMIVWTGGAGTINLPAVGDVVAGFYCSYNNEGSGEVIVLPNVPGETIDGLTQLTLGLGQSVTIITDHTKWYTLGFGKQTFSAVTILQKTVAGSSNVTLDAIEASKSIIQFNGALTGNITVFFPVIVQEWNLFNNTSGAFELRVQLVGSVGTSYVVPQGARQIFYSNGSSSIFDIPTVINTSAETFPDGDAANPGIAFTDDLTSGFFYNGGIPDLGISVGGVEISNFQASGEVLSPGLSLKLSDGTAASITELSTNIAYSQIATTVGANTANLHLGVPSATAATLSIIPAGAGPAIVLTADAASAVVNYNAVDSISINATGVVSFPQTAETLAALMPVSVAGALAYYNGTAWVTLAPGANGDTLKIAGGIPTWTP